MHRQNAGKQFELEQQQIADPAGDGPLINNLSGIPNFSFSTSIFTERTQQRIPGTSQMQNVSGHAV